VSADGIYRRVPVAIWTEMGVLSDAAIVLLLRLRTGPETTPIPGVVVAGRAGLAEALGWPARRLDAAYRELETRGLVRADWRARLIWLPAVIGGAPPANPSVVMGWRSTWPQIPACPLRDEVASALGAAVSARGPTYAAAWAGTVGSTVPDIVSDTMGDTASSTVGDTMPDTGGGSGGVRGSGGGRGGGLPPTVTGSGGAGSEAIEVACAAYRAVLGREPPPLSPREAQRIGRALAALEDLELVREIATTYYRSLGARPGDTYWSDSGWPWHLLVSQGIPALQARALTARNGTRRRSRYPELTE